ncbi:hypothetical protein [Streptomyces lunaelactis]|uniref:hypothetical protein n=1 Tax=Streptomyces lunaelactis TaxID=1535768 RepID=UPI0015844DAF|nr:hypothetical protein [Streptomyces lunaelactis]NUK22046.1 hypothetical protein [Streptomyces lunaelactis]
MIPAPQFTDEQRAQLQASINEAVRGIQAAFEAIAQALTNAAKGFASVQEAFTLAPPPEEPTPPHGHLPGERTAKDCRACASELFDDYWRNTPKEPTP